MMNQTKVHVNDVDGLIRTGHYVLDIRTRLEYELGHIGHSPVIPVDELEDRLDELPKNKCIYLYCESGQRGNKAIKVLTKHGFKAINLVGGYAAYTGELKQVGSPVVIDPNRIKIEASGLQCPGPLLKVTEVMEQLQTGDQLEMTVTDFGFCTDIEAWAKKTGHTVIKNEALDNQVVVILQKSEVQENPHPLVETKDGATVVVFSGDLDKALASFIIATGARAMGKEVTMFFTFWGLNIIKDPHAPKLKKTGLDKLFSKMMPKSAAKLPISKMNMFGLGSKMIQFVMKNKKVDALSEMIAKAEALGVKMVACTMSMDVMAIERDELLPFIEFGGVGTYLGDAEDSHLNLFI